MPIYAKIEDGIAVEYPIFEGTLQERFPDLSFPLDESNTQIPENYVAVQYQPPPVDFANKYLQAMPTQVNGGWVTTYTQEPLTDVERGILHDVIADRVRKIRDNLLDSSDKLVTIDRWMTYTDEKKTELTQYRQNLRDLTLQQGFPYDVSFPPIPAN